MPEIQRPSVGAGQPETNLPVDLSTLVFGTARYGAAKVDGIIVPTPGPHDDQVRLIQEAVSLGYNFFDTAQGYGDSEVVVGQALSGHLRDEVFIATKVGMQPDSDIDTSIAKSVDRLGTEPDVLYIHNRWDGILDGSMDDCLEAVDNAIDAGLAGHIGISNFRLDELNYALGSLRNPVLFYQAKVNLHAPRPDAAELFELCQAERIQFTASSTLDRGGVFEVDNPALAEMTKRYDLTLAQLAILGVSSLGILPVVQTHNLEHMAENMRSLNTELDKQDEQYLADILLSRTS